MSPLRICLGKSADAACLLLTIAFLIAGCATPPHPPEQLAASITRTGRFTVRYMDTQGETRHLYGHFSWRGSEEDIALHLSNPLGQTLAVIQSAPSGASLKVPGRALQRAQHVEALMQNTLGFALPINALRNWINATAAPGSQALIQRDPRSGRPLRIQQDGWTVDYRPDSEHTTRAQQIHLKRTMPPIDVKLVLQP